MKARGLLYVGMTALLLGVVILVSRPGSVHAEGLQIRPLLYQQQLKPSETQKGHVDVSNATHTPITIQLKVRGFRQIDGNGNLEFYDSQAVRAAVALDLTEVDLGPSEAIRLYFTVDATKLPAGDNFAAIFAATKVETSAGAAPSAQVGTLLILENGPGGAHRAAVEAVSVPLISFTDTLQGTAEVRNTAEKGTSNAFFPKMTVSIGPWLGSERQYQGPLVFGGITRKVPVSVSTTNRIGPYKLTVATQGGMQERWVFLMTGFWRWLLPLVVFVVFVVFVLWRRLRRTRRHKVAGGSALQPDAGHPQGERTASALNESADKTVPEQKSETSQNPPAKEDEPQAKHSKEKSEEK